ncbi:hypothetical protein P8452_62570 [Trifolium repens]|nr:hypothetical protein P8452_62570 [Trifolium repens]
MIVLMTIKDLISCRGIAESEGSNHLTLGFYSIKILLCGYKETLLPIAKLQSSFHNDQHLSIFHRVRKSNSEIERKKIDRLHLLMPKSSNFAHSQQLCRREVSVDQRRLIARSGSWSK